MGTAKWWVCDDCMSLNDLPANKCYKCRVAKPGDPKLFDDQYSQVGGGGGRVAVTVDLAQVGDLTRPDPTETAEGGGVMESFEKSDDVYAGLDDKPTTSTTPRYDPYAGGLEPTPSVPQTTPSQTPPLRAPVSRGIEAIGGRHWTEEPAPMAEPEPAAPPPPPAAPPPPSSQGAAPPAPQAAPPPPGAVPPPPEGAVPPPPPAPRDE